MTQHSPPPLNSSETLRSLIKFKRQRGQLAESLVLARLGSRIAKQEALGFSSDELSRLALTRYLELMPEDTEVRTALEQISPSIFSFNTQADKARTGIFRVGMRRWLLWMLFIMGGISTAGAIHFNGLPLSADSVPVNSIIVKKIKQPHLAASAVPNAMVAEQPIVIRAVGDVVLGSNFPENHLPGEEDKKRIAALRDELRSADIVVGNLEGVLFDGGKSRKNVSRPEFYSFRMPESYATTLHEMGFDVLSLANNHSLDFGNEGLDATLRVLNAEGIHPVGVPGAEMALVKVRNTTLAFVNFSYLRAFSRLDDESKIRSEIQQARAVADMVIVLVHGGREGETAAGAPQGDEYFLQEYRGDMLKFSHLAIDAGASAVFGHGPHVVRPYEVYKDKPIFFSLGNFVGFRSLSTKGKLASSIIAEVSFSPGGKLLATGVIPLKMDASGIPMVDYSTHTLNALDDLLDKQLDKRPILKLSAQASQVKR